MSSEPTLQFPNEPQAQKRRRRWQIALIAVLGILVLLLPIGTYLLVRGGGDQSAAPGGGPSASPPPATASPSPSRSRAPDGHISLETLGNSTLNIPSWPVDNVQGPSGRLHFHDGTYQIPQPTGTATQQQPPTGRELIILSVTYGDVDRDGVDETVADIGCIIEGGSQQLVAFDRNASGQIVTMGRAVATTGEIRAIAGSTRVGSDGVVTARVGDFQACCGDETPRVWQNRGYGWSGGRFHQVSGPTRMTANPAVTETSISTGTLVLGPAVDGYRYGTLTVSIRNGWGTRPTSIQIHLYPSTGLERAGSAWPPISTPAHFTGYVATVTAPPARGTATYTFAFRRPAAISGGTLELEVGGATAAGAQLSEANPWNNGAIATIRTAN